MTLTAATPILELPKHGIAKLSAAMSRKLALAVSGLAGKEDIATANVEDLLYYFPMRYEDRSNFIGIDQLYDGLEASVELYTRVSGGFRVGKNRPSKSPPLYIFEISGSDVERTRRPVVVFWFVSGKGATHAIDHYQKRFAKGVRFVAFGRWEWDARRNTFALKIAKPDELEILPGGVADDSFGLLKEVDAEAPQTDTKDSAGDAENQILEEDLDSPDLAMIHTGRTVPVYRKLGQFRTKRLREIIFDIFQKLDAASISDRLPAELVEREGLISRAEALRQIHFPPEGADVSDYERFRSDAHRRLIFEEFFWAVFTLALIRGERKKEEKGALVEVTDETTRRIASLAPFPLTGAQKRVIRKILDDMTSRSPMNRLIQGDVGSGKTIVAFMAMMAAMENGYQAAIMAPTEILAEQHARNAASIFKDTGYKVALLKGSTKTADKKKIREAIASGEAQLIVGTHALIQEAVEFENLGLAVIDEQHRFGVLQRSALRAMGTNPDILVMTATPIPRSLAMTVYGDLDVSVIDELPPGRTPVKTVVVGEDQRHGVYKGIEREIALGRQAYVVYPLIEESEKLDIKAATKMYEELRDKIFPDLRVALIHGRMKAADKDEVMRQFVAGELDILVSTTVIEVGVDVPNASLMVIEHAERFGLSQLHQLRGRVGRGAEQSFCVLLTADKKTAVAKKRLGIMEETTDGFRIAEKDLEIRGQGEILGTRQSGIREFRIANIVRDLEILEKARDAAEFYLEQNRTSKTTQKLVGEAKSSTHYQLAAIG